MHAITTVVDNNTVPNGSYKSPGWNTNFQHVQDFDDDSESVPSHVQQQFHSQCLWENENRNCPDKPLWGDWCHCWSGSDDVCLGPGDMDLSRGGSHGHA